MVIYSGFTLYLPIYSGKWPSFIYIVDVPIKSRDVRFLVCLPEGMPEIMRTMGTYANHPLFSIHVFF